MSESQDFGDIESEGSEESPVIKQLRAKERADAKRLKELEDQVAQFETGLQSARESTAKDIVDSFGLPGLKDDVLNWVEGDLTADAVKEVLEAKGIPLPDVAAQPVPEPPQVPVSEVGQRVADVASGGAVKDTTERINEAGELAPGQRPNYGREMDELQAVMEEAGLTRSHG